MRGRKKWLVTNDDGDTLWVTSVRWRKAACLPPRLADGSAASEKWSKNASLHCTVHLYVRASSQLAVMPVFSAGSVTDSADCRIWLVDCLLWQARYPERTRPSTSPSLSFYASASYDGASICRSQVRSRSRAPQAE